MSNTNELKILEPAVIATKQDKLAGKEVSYELTNPSEEDLEFNRDEAELVYDRGYAWIIVLSSFILHFILLGIQYSFGVYLLYYVQYDYSDTPKSTLSLIGTIATAMLLAGGLIAGKLADKFGYRLMIMVGITVFSIGFLLASYSYEPWHLFLTQGVMAGLGSSIAFFPAVSIASQWFDKKRGLAIGICVSGSGIGGLAITPLTQLMISNLGVGWALRITAIFSFVIGIGASFLIKEQIVSEKRGKLIDLSIFKQKKFVILWLGGFISNFGYLIPFFLLPLYAKNYNLSDSQSSLVLGLLNGGNALGRIVMGRLADKFGKINMMFIGLFSSSLSCFLIWTFSQTFVPIIVFAVIYGIVGGAYFSLLPTVSPTLFGLKNIASTNGLLYLSNFIPTLVGTPIATAILNSTNAFDGVLGHQNYILVIVFSGLSALVGSGFIIWLKYLANPKFFVKV